MHHILLLLALILLTACGGRPMGVPHITRQTIQETGHAPRQGERQIITTQHSDLAQGLQMSDQQRLQLLAGRIASHVHRRVELVTESHSTSFLRYYLITDVVSLAPPLAAH